jgi:uncharacterized membrane protein YfcA
MQTYLWVCVILFLAGFTHGLSGFGSVLLSIPLLAIFLDIKIVIPLAALAAVTMTVMILIQLRQQFDWKRIYPLVIGAIPGVVVGVFALKRLNREIIHWILGVILITYSLYGLSAKTSDKEIPVIWAYPFGFLAGCFGGAFSAVGPPVIVYTSLQAWNKDQIKVTLQGFFLISGLLVVFCHAMGGLTTSTVLLLYGFALPTLVLGTYLGSLLYGVIREEAYRKVIIVLLGLLGILMIYRA